MVGGLRLKRPPSLRDYRSVFWRKPRTCVRGDRKPRLRRCPANTGSPAQLLVQLFSELTGKFGLLVGDVDCLTGVGLVVVQFEVTVLMFDQPMIFRAKGLSVPEVTDHSGAMGSI